MKSHKRVPKAVLARVQTDRSQSVPVSASQALPAKNRIIVGLGELLWDLFPRGKQLGGAPANFAYMTSLLGDRGIVASRVGNDRLGNAAARRLNRLGLLTSSLQVDNDHPTGTVKVEVDPKGQPKFEIAKSVAWDFFDWTPQWQVLADQAEAVCFGSLAQRSPQSRETIRRFLQAVRPNALRVFDVNLRQEFYSAETLKDSISAAHIMKVNQDELPIVARLLGCSYSSKEASAQWIRRKYGVQLLCVTQGSEGSLLVSEKTFHQHPGFPVKVADTVGAGDAFTAGLVHYYLRGASLDEMNIAANRMGAWVASEIGATPSPNTPLLRSIRLTGDSSAPASG